MSDWKSIVAAKQAFRESLIPAEYKVTESLLPALNSDSVIDFPSKSGMLTSRELEITETDDIDELLSKLASKEYTCVEVLEAFIKRTVLAHQLINPLTEIHFNDARELAIELDEWMAATGQPKGPLHGLPVSLKDQFKIKGSDSTIGYVSYVGQVAQEDAVLTDLLKQAGAIPFVKTNLPQTIMYPETQNHLFGITRNPHNRLLHAGGSSGGEGALVAFKGSPLGVGTDVGGSIRIPAGFNGIFGFRPSSHRLPYWGAVNSLQGQESIPSVIGPLARSISGLVTFTKAILQQNPWLYDPLVPQIEWREETFQKAKTTRFLNIGIMWDDGKVRPFPPYTRALTKIVTALKKQFHDVIEFQPFQTDSAMELLDQIFSADGGKDIQTAIQPLNEPLGSNVSGIGKSEITAFQQWQLNVRKNQFRKEFLDHWNQTALITKQGKPIDVLICPTSVYSALPHGSDCHISYTGLFNLVDYPAIAIPVTKVDPILDAKPEPQQPFLSELDEIWSNRYDPTLLQGAPISVQIVARRYQEEQLLGYAHQIHQALLDST